ncbi:MAG: hypothetical protein L0338_26420 [Acidobacteria bacterium]|nr:hypothetical protein [Acidobacteriota bacterium]
MPQTRTLTSQPTSKHRRPFHSLKARTSSVFQRWQPTTVFETFWKFAAERQAIFYRRLSKEPAPWTTDHTLATFKFTNAYRASDRVSQFLIRRVIYQGDQSPREVFFRTILFKLFNKIQTWRLLCNSFGDLTSAIPLDEIDVVLSNAMNAGSTIYSGAYIMPSGTKELRMERKHRTHLCLLGMMLKDNVPERITDSRKMSDAFHILRSYPMLGNFLAYQYLIDLNYSHALNFSESEFVVPGPGARSGLQKCFLNLDKLDETDVIRAIAENQESQFLSRGLQFLDLRGRPLQLIDCQNLLCEIDKYSRVVHPEMHGQFQRTRIKQKFTPQSEPIEYWYPPKWGINAQFSADSLVMTSVPNGRKQPSIPH